MAVVDPELRVADAAIMLTVVSGNINAATIMIGERIVNLVREKLRLAA
jgi:choline dehydrogenase